MVFIGFYFVANLQTSTRSGTCVLDPYVIPVFASVTVWRQCAVPGTAGTQIESTSTSSRHVLYSVGGRLGLQRSGTRFTLVPCIPENVLVRHYDYYYSNSESTSTRFLASGTGVGGWEGTCLLLSVCTYRNVVILARKVVVHCSLPGMYLYTGFCGKL